MDYYKKFLESLMTKGVAGYPEIDYNLGIVSLDSLLKDVSDSDIEKLLGYN